MSQYTIAIPEPLLEKAQRVAQRTDRPVDDVILATLQGGLDQPALDLPAEERAELKAMAYLSDDTLWTIAREQLPRPARERAETLMGKNALGQLSDAEHAELSDLVERGNQLTLRKAQALKYLTERGFQIAFDDLNPAYA